LDLMAAENLRFESEHAVTEACRKDGKSYVIFEDNVLDVAKFVHPGPQSLITSNIGKDITAPFTKQSHSSHARFLCEKMTIGRVGPGVAEGKLLKVPNKYEGLTLTEEEEKVHASLDSKIDVTKPLLAQVSKLTNREFKALISRPRHTENEDSVQLYSDPEVDRNSKRGFKDTCNGIGPVVAVLLLTGFWTAHSLGAFVFNVAVFFTCGFAFVWTGIEYVFHRFLLHRELELDVNAKADGAHLAKIFSAHLHHHVFMNQRYRIVVTPSVYIKYMVPSFVVAIFVASPAVYTIFFAGVMAGALMYDAVHLSFHFTDIFPEWVYATQYFQNQRNAHMRHHYRDNTKEFGVTSGLWDSIMGTTRT